MVKDMFSKRNYINITLVTIFIIVYLLGVDPYSFGLSLYNSEEYYRLLTNMFLHSGCLHLLMNSFVLLYLGYSFIEYKLKNYLLILIPGGLYCILFYY
jgi:membrane associated rhomboid family serine protease